MKQKDKGHMMVLLTLSLTQNTISTIISSNYALWSWNWFIDKYCTMYYLEVNWIYIKKTQINSDNNLLINAEFSNWMNFTMWNYQQLQKFLLKTSD